MPKRERDILELYLICHLDEGDIALLLKTSRTDVKSEIRFITELILHELNKHGIYKEYSNFFEDSDLLKAFDLYIEKKMEKQEIGIEAPYTTELHAFSEENTFLQSLERLVAKQYIRFGGKLISKAAVCFFLFLCSLWELSMPCITYT